MRVEKAMMKHKLSDYDRQKNWS